MERVGKCRRNRPHDDQTAASSRFGRLVVCGLCNVHVQQAVVVQWLIVRDVYGKFLRSGVRVSVVHLFFLIT